MKKKFISFSMAILIIIGSFYAPGVFYAAEISVAPAQEESLPAIEETIADEIELTEPKETTEENEKTEPGETTEQTEPAKSVEVPEQTVLAESDEVAVEAITVYAETGIPAFVERLYTIVLGRASDPAGKAYWINRVQGGQTTGSALAAGFILSNEYKAKNTSNLEYVEMLYKTILNRDPDSTGKAYWLGKLEDGVSRNGVFAGFANSDEFRKLCGSYGIGAGSWSSDEARDRNYAATAFVQRLYKTFLGRNADVAGLNDWCQKLCDGWGGIDIAASFLFSTEFKSKEILLDDYLTLLYRAFLDRAPDTAGLQHWSFWVSEGSETAASVINGFAGSTEFRKLCSSYGINPGSANVKGRLPNVIYEPLCTSGN